ncbi:hypothetical protein TIFTF001_046663 [Ficus carica]|uniref:Uncharacterized protein n=1 Tax=Ficus carica TaxID=3494 RepID=A0AA88A2I2_FICCA|nr:hypothetical protein TIFTF001_046659 [Ficus carica]GMN33066.1 hypothetical protein TIFTF001_046663 [Ficus carica]
MIGDWCRFNADECEVKAFWADQELQWNGAGDSYYRSCGSRRWCAHQRTRSPPPTHRYPHSPPSSSLRTHRHPSFPSPPSSSSSQTHQHHSFPSLPSSSSSQTHRHHSLSFPPPPSSPKNHPHRDFPNHNYQQNYKSTRLSTSTVSKRSSNLTENGRTRGSDRFSSLTEKHRCLGSLKEQRVGTRISSRKREQRGGSGDTMHFSDTTANHCGDGGSRFSVPTPTSRTTLELGLASAPTFTVRREHREAEENDKLFSEEKNVVEDTLMVTKLSLSRASLESINDEFTEEECDGQDIVTQIKTVQPNVILEEQDLCNLGVKHTLGFVGKTVEEKSVFVAMDFNNDDESTGFGHEATVEIVPISSIEQSLCLVDQSSAKDNFNKCDIVTEALELIPTYIEHITIPHTNLEEFMVKSQELTCGSVDLSLDNILKPYKVYLQQQDFKQQVQVFLGRTSYEFTKGCTLSNGQNQCNHCKELVITWKVSLLPLWIWDELRRDFSVGVYHSHKTNIITLFVNFSKLPSFLISAGRVSCCMIFLSMCFSRTQGRVLFKEGVN